jgi:hypothetical protein
MTERHESCCAVYNEPAYPNGPCDCKYKTPNVETIKAMKETDLPSFASVEELMADLEADDPISEALDKAVEAIRMSDQ